MSEHYDLVCENGYKHGSCKCGAKDKKVRKIVCGNPEHQKNSLNKIGDSVSTKLSELYDLINEFASATGQSKLDKDRNTHEEFALLAHDAVIAAKSQYDTAQRALWP